MWKVAVVQPVTEGFGFNITTETSPAARLIRLRDAGRSRGGSNSCSGGCRESRFGGSRLQSAAPAPMVGRFIGFVEQMKHGCGLSSAEAPTEAALYLSPNCVISS